MEFATILTYLFFSALFLAVPIFVVYKLVKRLIRYGVDYYFQEKTYYDNRKIIDDIEAEINVHGED